MIGKAEMHEYDEAQVAAARNPYRWFAASHAEAETWQGGYNTREEAIDDGQESFGPDSFAICEANATMVQPIFTAEYHAEVIIEGLIENNEECWGEDGAGTENHGPVNDLTRRLEAHPWKGWCFDDVRTTEEIPGEPGDPRN